MKDCCGIPYRPEWSKETDGDWAFISVCPTCYKRTECAPGGSDMQNLHTLISKCPPPPPPEPEPPDESAATMAEAKDANAAIRIWSDFKWWTRQADRTWDDIATKLNECIGRCRSEMVTAKTRDETIAKLEQMLNRASEFTVGEE